MDDNQDDRRSSSVYSDTPPEIPPRNPARDSDLSREFRRLKLKLTGEASRSRSNADDNASQTSPPRIGNNQEIESPLPKPTVAGQDSGREPHTPEHQTRAKDFANPKEAEPGFDLVEWLSRPEPGHESGPSSGTVPPNAPEPPSRSSAALEKVMLKAIWNGSVPGKGEAEGKAEGEDTGKGGK